MGIGCAAYVLRPSHSQIVTVFDQDFGLPLGFIFTMLFNDISRCILKGEPIDFMGHLGGAVTGFLIAISMSF